mmetsp:Transcript_62163/g.183786  ORF Transcript_62163/g.183786 Transcript_62163/m.183786 type:complete len:905 (-) Transcript_62163:578-3292(-)
MAGGRRHLSAVGLRLGLSRVVVESRRDRERGEASNEMAPKSTAIKSIRSRDERPISRHSLTSESSKEPGKKCTNCYKPAVAAILLAVLYITILTLLWMLTRVSVNPEGRDQNVGIAAALRKSKEKSTSQTDFRIQTENEPRRAFLSAELGLSEALSNAVDTSKGMARKAEHAIFDAERGIEAYAEGVDQAVKKIARDSKSVVEDALWSGNNGFLASSSDVVRTLTAYLEPIHQSDWEIKPLPTRNCTSSTLRIRHFPRLNSCTKLTEQWPVNEPCPTDDDPFLPWIHDVFPTADGKYVQFVAQNKRRCQTGSEMDDIKKHMQPQASLFQHVPVKRIHGEQRDGSETRYRLSSHEDADPDGTETRFICRFKPLGVETLSVHNFNYDQHTFRKGYKATATEEGFDNHMIWTSQLLFRCPVPENLVDIVQSGSSVENDYATMFIDLIPIRTPPRYGLPASFLPPRYEINNTFIADDEWGRSHILPLIEDSGRWENIPICKPTLKTYLSTENQERGIVAQSPQVEKPWTLVSCVWMSASFQTRGGRRLVTDNVRRLQEWLEFNFLSGFDHIIIYDNSGAQNQTGNQTLQPVTDLYPGRVTRINWPCKVCNNRPGTGDNKGERSSQYAAESSCRLRFGPHTEWLGSFDVDEYLVPMANFDNMKDVVRAMDKKDAKILTFKSIRAWARRSVLQDPAKTALTNSACPRGCFDPVVPPQTTFMQTYNCDREETPRYNVMPAEKQIYRPDYVLLHFVHYSTVTTVSIMTPLELETAGLDPKKRRYKEKSNHIMDEDSEARMLHTKSIKYQDTRNWRKTCRLRPRQTLSEPLPPRVFNSLHPMCKLGTPFPPGKNWDTQNETLKDAANWVYNCFMVEKIENYWVPKLVDSLNHMMGNKTFRVHSDTDNCPTCFF